MSLHRYDMKGQAQQTFLCKTWWLVNRRWNLCFSGLWISIHNSSIVWFRFVLASKVCMWLWLVKACDTSCILQTSWMVTLTNWSSGCEFNFFLKRKKISKHLKILKKIGGQKKIPSKSCYIVTTCMDGFHWSPIVQLKPLSYSHIMKVNTSI